MKLCVTSYGSDLESKVDPRFGRCEYFIIIDTDAMSYEAINNPAGQSGGGAGIQSGQLISEKKCDAVLTGAVGPNAFQVLNAAGIKIFTGASGTVREAIEKFKKGEYNNTDKATAESHSGMK